MHNRLAKDGLAVVSVTIDDPDDTDARQRALQFLKDQKATFTNLALAQGEDWDDWVAKLKLPDVGIPRQLVYNRQGSIAKQFSGQLEEIEDLVEKLLKKQ